MNNDDFLKQIQKVRQKDLNMLHKQSDQLQTNIDIIDAYVKENDELKQQQADLLKLQEATIDDTKKLKYYFNIQNILFLLIIFLLIIFLFV
jgi:hypothetical protein